MSDRHLGYCVGVLRPNEITFTSFVPPKMGEFVLITYREGDRDVRILGMVNYIERFDRFLPEDNNPDHVASISKIYRIGGIFRARTTLLGEIGKDGRLVRLKYPPMPGAPVYSAPPDVLQEIFAAEDPLRTAKIGTLLTSPDVEVGVDINQIVSRHLAILAVTGGGKSNAVSVILEEIAKKNGTALVIDVHGEYIDAQFRNSRGEVVTNPIDVRIDLASMPPGDIAAMCGIDFDRSSRQYYVMMELVKCVKENRRRAAILDVMDSDPFSDDLPANPSFMDDLIDTLRALIEARRSKEEDVEAPCEFYRTTKPDELIGTYIRLVNLRDKIGDRVQDNATPIVELVGRYGEGKINVLDLRGLDYEAMDVIVSHVLLSFLKERKRWVQEGEGHLRVPVLVVVEEAHIFAPKGVSTKTKYALSKVAREARKFGLGVVLVSQRPKGLDENVLSQMNNWIILRIVEPEDQKHVQRASETLSSDLLQYLPALNPGEAILLGPFVRVPLLVKFRLSQARRGGHDIDAVGEWSRYSSR